MARDNSVNFYSKYYFGLKKDSNKRYSDKLKLLNCEEDPYKRLESPAWHAFSGMAIQWHECEQEWLNLMHPDIYI